MKQATPPAAGAPAPAPTPRVFQTAYPDRFARIGSGFLHGRITPFILLRGDEDGEEFALLHGWQARALAAALVEFAQWQEAAAARIDAQGVQINEQTR